jgi:hypothetical protein
MARGYSGLEDAIRDVGENVSQNISHYHALPPLKKNRFRAGAGAALVGLAVYSAAGRHDIVFADGLSFGIWVVVVAFGLLWFFVGAHGAVSPRDVLSAVYSSIGAAFFGLAAFAFGQALDGGDFDFFLEGFFLACVVACIVRFWLAVRGLPGANLEAVRAQQAHGRARDASPAEAAARLDPDAGPPRRQFSD